MRMEYSEIRQREEVLEQTRMSVLRIMNLIIEKAEEWYPAHAQGLDVVPSEEISDQQYVWAQVQKLQRAKEVLETNTNKVQWYQVALPLSEELLGGMHPLSHMSEVVSGNIYELGNALIRFCNAVEPFSSQERMWNHVILHTILPLLGTALNRAESLSVGDMIYPPGMEVGDTFIRERAFLSQQLDFLTRSDTEPHTRIMLVRWIQSAYTDGPGYAWIDQRTRTKIDEFITQVDATTV